MVLSSPVSYGLCIIVKTFLETTKPQTLEMCPPNQTDRSRFASLVRQGVRFRQYAAQPSNSD